MSKMDALNQKTVCRVFRALRNADIGLIKEEDLHRCLESVQTDYYDEMIEIMEETING